MYFIYFIYLYISNLTRVFFLFVNMHYALQLLYAVIKSLHCFSFLILFYINIKKCIF